MKRPLWGILALVAASLCVYAASGPEADETPTIRIEGRFERFVPGQEVPNSVAAIAPREAIESFSPADNPIPIPPSSKSKNQARLQDELTDLERSRLVKRGADRKPQRELAYRFRVKDNWEIYRVPAEIRVQLRETRTAMHLAREASGRSVVTARGKKGFEITKIQPGSLLEEAGLISGDVIISVNGEPVTSAADGRRVYGLLKFEDHFDVVVDRGGEILHLYYEVEG